MQNNLTNNINNDLNNNNLEIENNQKNFLESALGKTINAGVDIGIRAILPDFIEEEVINLKDNLLNYGLKDGIKKSIDDAIDLGKSVIGVVTGNFENMSQAQNAIKSGGILDNLSKTLDSAINKAYSKGLINYNVSKTLNQGKNTILRNIEKNIEKTFNSQINALSYTDKYINNWKESFNNKDFEGMEREFKKIKKEINNLMPIEKTINDVRTIENLHTLIKNNGKDFNLTQEQLELAEKLK